jgi:hypothetical protein
MLPHEYVPTRLDVDCSAKTPVKSPARKGSKRPSGRGRGRGCGRGTHSELEERPNQDTDEGALPARGSGGSGRGRGRGRGSRKNPDPAAFGQVPQAPAGQEGGRDYGGMAG